MRRWGGLREEKRCGKEVGKSGWLERDGGEERWVNEMVRGRRGK